MKNYNFLQKLLHDFALSGKFINKSLFELDKILYLDKDNLSLAKKTSHIFISGMPRSGTTSVLDYLYSLNEFASLKYSNMPFILSPNLPLVFSKKNLVKKERSHGDGLSIDLNSPEAFDEFFFNCDLKFIRKELLNYISLILKSQNKNKYLSKNNLNYKRIDLINSIFPNACFLITIREPLQQSFSLLNQHLNFTKLNEKDKFIERYMRYLGHYEFGPNHQSWNEPKKYNEYKNINYWLEQWLMFYENIFEKLFNKKNCFFLIYEKLQNENYLKSILERIKINKKLIKNFKHFKNSNKNNLNLSFNEDLYKNCLNIYKKFDI